ncbi:hypothetical protein BD413DRAFT_109535 [Trametes elegans]|nr:hypothetical protein BD413DRAFT_109535 [Trametes elegans]
MCCACHQCRRRKLKCDAKRPCSTCIRSHSYAAAHAPPGSDLPSHPECTFDDASESEPSSAGELQDVDPKNRFEQLENRINELESLLQEKEGGIPRSRSASMTGFERSTSFIMGYSADNTLTNGSLSFNGHPDMMHISSGASLDELAGIASLVGDQLHNQHHSDTSTTLSNFPHAYLDSSASDLDMTVVNPGWPKDLPDYTHLRQLVEACFLFTPSITRMFHAPNFMAALSFPPTHLKFPPTAVLHAMCALGSMYNAAVAGTPSPPLPSPYDDGGNSIKSLATDAFAELQISSARQCIDAALRSSSDFFGTLQAQVLVALWYWYNARWSEACIAFALSLRYAIPCGLNACAPFESISSSSVARTSVIPPASDVVEDEARRSTFWMAYMMERHFAAINNIAMMVDDEDISQMLPVRGEEFEQGRLVPPNERQWSFEPNIFENHPSGQVDSFVLHLKATILLSKVKVFNNRYKVKRHLGDPNMQPDPAGIPGMPGRSNLVQSSPAFLELERLLAAFIDSLPEKFRDPLSYGVVDTNLLTALSIIHLAVIIMHESHANIGSAACVSSAKVLNAARGILNLLHRAHSTSQNLALMGVFPMVCWFVAGRVLVRFLRAAIQAKSDEHIVTLRTEVDFIRSVISKIGESIPHAYHYSKMLKDYLVQTCGQQYATPFTPQNIAPPEGAARSPFRNSQPYHDSQLGHDIPGNDSS